MLLWIAAAALIGVWAMDEKREARPAASAERQRAIAIIRAEAQRQGVPAPIALAFAEAESNFNAAAAGDLGWASKRPELYRQIVLDNPAMAQNPARTDPRAWHSYGLFQLLAPYHTRPTEHPKVLYDPTINAHRGIAFIRGLLRKHSDDLVQTRLAYAGALRASQAEQDRVLARFARIYQRWAETDGANA